MKKAKSKIHWKEEKKACGFQSSPVAFKAVMDV